VIWHSSCCQDYLCGAGESFLAPSYAFLFGCAVSLVPSVLIGLFLIVSGGLLIWGQQAPAILFDMRGGATFESDPLTTAMGIRQFCIGLMIVSLASLRQTKALGVIMIIGALVPLADFISFIPRIGVLSAMRHGGIVPVVLAVGLFFLTRKSTDTS